MARILLIDDDDPLRTVMARAIQRGGHEVIEAVDGRQGVELFHATEVDLVITDLIMPGQEGVETIVQLRRARPSLPIIAISGGVSNSKLYLEIAAKIGARSILSKPFEVAELLARINDVLRPTDSGGTPSPKG
jgi:DNA-binding response OmpR family regulator